MNPSTGIEVSKIGLDALCWGLMRRLWPGVAFLCLLISTPLLANDGVDLQVMSQIREEGTKRSEVATLLSYLTDVYGPRLTGSSNLRRAAEWSVKELGEWGFGDARLEPWGDFGYGWELERCRVELTEPYYMPLIAYVKAWTKGTKGVLSGSPMLVEIEREEDLVLYKGQLDGSIVLLDRRVSPATSFSADAARFTEADLGLIATAETDQEDTERRRREYREKRRFEQQVIEFIEKEGAAAIIEAGRGSHGTVFVGRGGSFREVEKLGGPSFVLAPEHFGLLRRLVERDQKVSLELESKVRLNTEDREGFNVIADWVGEDPELRDEIVMLGAHLDSWHAATGATDNAAGCAVAMEAVRILKEIGVRPRRTVRIALWSGEEQGLLGSRNYVQKHFKDGERFTEEHSRISAYYNLDNGTGRIRGIYLQGNDAARPLFEAFLKPFADLGASTVTIRDTGGTDHLSFDAVGIPAFQFIQDPIAYDTRTHHSNMDLNEHALEADLKQAAVILAAFVYNTAMRNEMIPRKPLAARKSAPKSRR